MIRRPSIIYEVLARFDSLKAVGVSRHAAKRRLRARALAAGCPMPLAPSTGRIHADKTAATYKGIALRYARWARETQGITRLAALDAEAGWLVALYLETRLAAGDSPYTLATIRSALRMLHRPAYPPAEREARVRLLGAGIILPVRRRTAIRRSRGPVAMDRALALRRYAAIVAFCHATGVRRRELAALVAGDIRDDGRGGLVVLVRNSKGGKRRLVPVLPGREDDVRRAAKGHARRDLLFPRVPVRLDVHAYRRLYAQDLYREDGRRPLPDPAGRLAPGTIDRERAFYVARALGHNRIDVVVRHYLR